MSDNECDVQFVRDHLNRFFLRVSPDGSHALDIELTLAAAMKMRDGLDTMISDMQAVQQ